MGIGVIMVDIRVMVEKMVGLWSVSIYNDMFWYDFLKLNPFEYTIWSNNNNKDKAYDGKMVSLWGVGMFWYDFWLMF
jgi:hypothetical protein